MADPNFFAQLKQRKLVQWTVAYVAAAFALLQGIDIVAQRFDWPPQAIRLVILGMIVGFFVTLVLAWYHRERGEQRVSGTELLILALLHAETYFHQHTLRLMPIPTGGRVRATGRNT